jgi:hypothetical protein
VASKIEFERFTAMSDDVGQIVEQVRGNRLMSAPWRLWELALCRMNNWGHAAFDVDELEMLVCGCKGKSERQVLKRAFDTLIDLGRISPESTTLCVVVNTDLWARGAGKGAWDHACSEPSHRAHRRHRWSGKQGWRLPDVDVPESTFNDPWGTPNVPAGTSSVPDRGGWSA